MTKSYGGISLGVEKSHDIIMKEQITTIKPTDAQCSFEERFADPNFIVKKGIHSLSRHQLAEFVKKLDCFELYPAFNGNRKSPENWCHSFRSSRRDPNKQVIAFRETCKHFEAVKPYLLQSKESIATIRPKGPFQESTFLNKEIPEQKAFIVGMAALGIIGAVVVFGLLLLLVK
jgi:hypothetical protein